MSNVLNCMVTLILLAGCATPKPTTKTAVPAAIPASMAPTPTAEPQPALQWREMDMVSRDGTFHCECAQKSSGEIVCRNCERWLTARTVPKLEPALDEHGNPIPTQSAFTKPLKPRKVSFEGPPGRFISHVIRTPHGDGHEFVGPSGQHYFCPFRPGCDRYADKENLDEACLDYGKCLVISVDSNDDIVW